MKLKRIPVNLLLGSFPLFFFLNKTSAQAIISDTSFYASALLNAKALYHEAFGSQSALYNGIQYGEYLFTFSNGGHPFFYSAQPGLGSIVYDGIQYDSVLMSYDETRDVVVINDYTDRIQLHSEKVKSFNLFNADFIRIEKDSLTPNLPATGFYNVLYHGKLSLLKRQIKTIREEIILNELQHFADEKDHYYIKKNDVLYPVGSRNDLLKIFKDRKKEVQQFIKANNLNFRRDREGMMIKTTVYYDNLKQ
jgi:hypothetical protein